MLLRSCYNESSRQKQYFEQRKRLQEQQMAREESYSDTGKPCTRPPINSQSLDILNFLDLSTISQQPRSSYPKGKPVYMFTRLEDIAFETPVFAFLYLYIFRWRWLKISGIKLFLLAI